MKEKQHEGTKKKDDGKVKPKREVPQARGSAKKALEEKKKAKPSVKKGGSLGQDLAAMMQRSQQDLSLMIEEKEAKEKELDSVDGQIQAFGEEVAERQTKIKALKLCRNQCLAEVEEKAAAVEKKKTELLETTNLHAKYVQENKSSSSSSYYSNYTEESEESEEEDPSKKKEGVRMRDL